MLLSSRVSISTIYCCIQSFGVAVSRFLILEFIHFAERWFSSAISGQHQRLEHWLVLVFWFSRILACWLCVKLVQELVACPLPHLSLGVLERAIARNLIELEFHSLWWSQRSPILLDLLVFGFPWLLYIACHMILPRNIRRWKWFTILTWALSSSWSVSPLGVLKAAYVDVGNWFLSSGLSLRRTHMAFLCFQIMILDQRIHQLFSFLLRRWVKLNDEASLFAAASYLWHKTDSSVLNYILEWLIGTRWLVPGLLKHLFALKNRYE